MVNWWIECHNLGFGDEYYLYGVRPNDDEPFRVTITGEQAAKLSDFLQGQRDELSALLWTMVGGDVPA